MPEPKNAPQAGTSLLEQITARPQQTIDFRQMGKPGLALGPSGVVMEERLRALMGQRGMQVYREMGESDSTIGTALSLCERSARQAQMTVAPASDHPEDQEAASFLESVFDDMDQVLSDILSDMVRGVLQYGFYLGAVQYKRRAGDAPEPYLKSQHRDGRIGIRGITGMAQESIYAWHCDELGQFKSVEQNAAPDYRFEVIPYDRLVHIRQSTHKNNPLGVSALRCAYRDWYLKSKIEAFAAIGAERSVAGLPVLRVPPEVLAGITPEDQAMLEACKKIATNIRVDEDGGIVFPMARDQNGQLLYDIELMSTNSNQIGELMKIISMLDYRIAASLNSEFIKLGDSGGATGSYAMHADKTDLHAQMLNSVLSNVADTFNRFVIPRLFAFNSFKVDKLPTVSFTKLGTTDLKSMGSFLQSAAAAGAVLFPNPDAEDRIMELVDLPPLPRIDGDAPAMPPMGDPRPDEVQEVHTGDVHPQEVAEAAANGAQAANDTAPVANAAT